MNPKISIITVVYNAKDDLAVTLDSISRLSYDNKEVIIIDGGSTDGTLDVICDFASFITYWKSEPDQGLYDAMNKGLRVATGEYVWFVNAGDLPYNDDVLDNVFLPTEHYPDIYYGEAMIISTSGEELGLRRKKLPKKLTKNSFKRGMVVCHQGFIVRAAIAPMYNTNLRYVADIEWVIACIDGAKKIQNTNTVICKFQEGGISTAHKKESLKERWRVMKCRYGLAVTLVSHIGFAFSLIFNNGYRRLKDDR